jgi:hypothetical protein
MGEEKSKSDVWHRHPVLAGIAGSLFTLICTAIYTDWQRTSESKLVVYTMGYTARGSREIPLLKIGVGENKVGWYWIYIRNLGSKPNHHVQITLDNVGQIKSISSDNKSTLRSLDGAVIQDIAQLEGATSLRFKVDSIPPNGSFFLAIFCHHDDVKGPPSLSVVSEETVGSIRVNDPSLEPVAASQFASWPKDLKDRVADLCKWE